MNKITQIKECRQNLRFKVQGMVIAVARPSSHPPGNIKEIDRSGLVFQYRANGNSRMITQELDIIWADYVAIHHLEKIPVQIVSDVLVEKGAKSNKSAARRQTVAFENITPYHENQLERLIRARGAIPI